MLIFIGFPWQQLLSERASMWRLYVHYMPCVFVIGSLGRDTWKCRCICLNKSCLKAVNARRPSGLTRSQRWVQKVLDTLSYLGEYERALRLHLMLPSNANDNCHFQGLLSLFALFPLFPSIVSILFSSHFFLLHYFPSSPLTKRPLPRAPITFAPVTAPVLALWDPNLYRTQTCAVNR